GSKWLERFDRLINGAESLEAPEAMTILSEAAIVKGAEIAMGLALRRADALATHAVALNVGREAGAGTAPERLWRARGLPFHCLILEDALPPVADGLDMAVNRVLVASTSPLELPEAMRGSARQHPANDIFYIELDDLPTALDLAQAMLGAAPECGLGLDYRTITRGDAELPGEDAPAFILARAAPAGSVWARWPQAAAIDVHTPHCRFEFAGEIVTPNGDCPVAEFYPVPPPVA
ncbi:MAG TPA: DUF4071 domain-containing protein, partial [Sphingobium sp.]|nr:DUF4071 domain-containing protein [Sphingobium sp.]